MEAQLIFKRRFLVALFNFILIASVGTTLRYVFIHEVKIVQDYRNVLHAHSHIAMMGWVFMALFSSLLYSFSPETSGRKFCNILFWTNQANAIILLVNFWFRGYDVLSTLLSTIYIIITYLFAINVVKNVRKNVTLNPVSRHLLYICLFFLFFSTLGVWGMIPTMLLLHGSLKVICYYLSVQFYIHFQYSGWFIFGCLALFFNMTKRVSKNIYEERSSLWIVYLLALCAVATFCLSIFWGFPEYHLFLNISVVAAFAQLFLSILLFLKNKTLVIEIWNQLKPGVKTLFAISFSALIIKQLLQVIIIYPEMAHSAFVLRNYVIAYLHLTFLGVTTIFLLGYAWQKDALIIQSVFLKVVLAAIVCCIFSIELLLSIMGSLSWAGMRTAPMFYQLVFICSLGIVVSVIIIWIKNILKRNRS